MSLVTMIDLPADHPFVDGFLSAEAAAVKSQVHERYPSEVALVYEINRRAVAIQHQLDIHVDNSAESFGAALYARTLTFAQSSALMLERGLPVQARTLLRAGLETLFALAALAKDRSVSDKLIASHHADRRDLIEKMDRWKDPALRSSITSVLSDAEQVAIAKGKGGAVNVFDFARTAGMEDWYLSLYVLLSFSAHSKVADLDRHVVLDEEGKPSAFRNEPEVSDQQATWVWTSEVLVVAMESIAALFGIGVVGLDGLRQRVAQLGRFPQATDKA